MKNIEIIILSIVSRSCYALLELEGIIINVDSDSLQNEDGELSFLELAAKYGFPNAEARNVITDDGYILGLHHIPGNPQQTVLLAHGNTADDICWILRGHSSLAITLANKGYDVWTVNSRGTMDLRRHVCLDPDTQHAQFFNYSSYEHGYYDLPAVIDYILEETNQQQLLAIGHSVGTTNFYVLGSERSEYNDKIKAFISLAPISFLQHIRGLASTASLLADTLTKLMGSIGQCEVCGRGELMAGAFNLTCLGPSGYTSCVEGIVFPLFGRNPQGFEVSFTPVFFGHYPDSSSKKLFENLLQVIKRDKFAQYDYGVSGNFAEYGTAEPPEFDLSKAVMKMAIFVGSNDYLATVPDAERLRDSLPNVVHYQVMPFEDFNHLDFVWGRDMTTNLYPYLLPIIDKYIN